MHHWTQPAPPCNAFACDNAGGLPAPSTCHVAARVQTLQAQSETLAGAILPLRAGRGPRDAGPAPPQPPTTRAEAARGDSAALQAPQPAQARAENGAGHHAQPLGAAPVSAVAVESPGGGGGAAPRVGGQYRTIHGSDVWMLGDWTAGAAMAASVFRVTAGPVKFAIGYYRLTEAKLWAPKGKFIALDLVQFNGVFVKLKVLPPRQCLPQGFAAASTCGGDRCDTMHVVQ